MNVHIFFNFLFIILCFFVIGLCVSQSYSVNLDKNIINLSNDDGNSSNPEIASYKNNVYIVWNDDTLGNNEIFFKRSADNGTTFGSTENLSVTNGSSVLPQISVSENYVLVSWIDYTSGNGDVYVRTSNDGGYTFSPLKNISNNLNGTVFNVSDYAEKNKFFVLWDDKTPLNEGIRFKASLDGGQNFNISKFLSKRGFPGSSDPTMYVNHNGINVVWLDKLMDKNGNLTNSEILYKLSKDNGNTFQNTKVVTRTNTDLSNPKITFLKNILFVTWENDVGGLSNIGKDHDILYKTSNNNGLNFSNIKPISRGIDDSRDVSMVPIADNLSVVWRSNIKQLKAADQWDLRFRTITNNGENVTTSKVITRYIGDYANSPQILVNNNTLYIIWSDKFSGISQNNNDIFMITSNNFGKSFSEPVNLSANSGNSVKPITILSNGHLFLIWTDYSDGKGEIYLKII